MANPSQQFIDIGKQNFATFVRFADLSMQNAARIFKIQTEAAKDVYAQNAKNLKQTLEQTRQNGATTPVFSLYKASLDKSWDVTRECIDAATQTQSELSEIFSQNMDQLNQITSQFVDQARETTRNAQSEVERMGDEAQRVTQRAKETSKAR